MTITSFPITTTTLNYQAVLDAPAATAADLAAIEILATQTAADAVATAADAVQTALDAAATAADVISAQAARDAAIAGAFQTWPTTAAGIGTGIAGVTSIVGGSGGTNGTFALAYSGGTQVIAPVGVFTVAGGALVSVVITYPGYYSAGTPTLSFAASAGLTGASATAQMAANTPVNEYFVLAPATITADENIVYRNVAGVATEVCRYPTAALVKRYLTPKKNMFDKSRLRAGFRYSPASDAVIVDALGRCTHFIPVTPGQVLTISGGVSGFTGGWFVTEADTGGLDMGFAPTTSFTVTVPAGRNFLVVNLTTTGSTAFDDTLQVEVGAGVTSYEAYQLVLDITKLKNSDLIPLLVAGSGKNMLDATACNYVNRYSKAGLNFTTDTLGIAASPYIPVVEGRTYTLSGAIYLPGDGAQGGYFTVAGAASAHSNITFFAPASGSGVSFTVPTGASITHVVFNLNKTGLNPAATTLAVPTQLEAGNSATTWEAYVARMVIRDANLPVSSGSSSTAGAIDDTAWFKYIEGESQPYHRDKWPVFTAKYLAKSADVCVLSSGTSLTARTTEHHSDYPNAKNRPPLMHSLNEASYIWDALVRGWDGQKYSRYDDTAVVTEASGTWATSAALAEWDDATYREGLTRYSDTNAASVSFAVPAGTWAWRLIHRTDSVASTALSIAISGGNSIAQVFDEGSSTWVEANGYTFSQREATPVTRSVSIPNPDTDAFASSTIATKGNTTYQKRLRLRFTNRTSARTVTITNTVNSTRFNYWGCEWSPRQFMLTYINAARGSHNTVATSSLGLPRFADNEVHSFKPDLIYTELPIHNDGASGAAVYATWDRWGRLTNNWAFRADYELSLTTRATFYGYTPEIGMWTPSIAYGFSGIDANGQLIAAAQTDGVVMTALDKFDQAAAWMRQNKPNNVFIHAVRRWVEAGFAIYGNLRTATEASSKVGPSMTNDGSHSNDLGAKVLAKLLVGPLDFGA